MEYPAGWICSAQVPDGDGCSLYPPPCAGARECPHFNRDCKEVAYFGVAPHGKEEAWQLAVDKIRELNPRGDIAQGRRYPTLQNLSGKQQEIANDF